MTDQTPIPTPFDSIADATLRRRAEWAASLCYAISECHPSDAAQIMTAALEDIEAGVPDHNPFGPVRADAVYWADIATPAEIEAYTAAGLRAIERQAFGIAARKRLMVMLWNSLGAQDKAAFLARVKGGGA